MIVVHIIFRILVLPLIVALALVGLVKQLVLITINFMRYGGDFVTKTDVSLSHVLNKLQELIDKQNKE
jgi:hypothetical protein